MTRAFVPRIKAPDANDLNYKKTTYGGYNFCILIDNSGSVLPNCVGYAWGRWRELIGGFHKLSRANAEDWWGNTGDGYRRSQTPELGSVACWREGRTYYGGDGAGHVAIVEAIKPDGTIITSNSAYKGSRFYTREIKPPYNMGGKYEFQGFIHLPFKMEVETNRKTDEEVAADIAAGRGGWGNNPGRAIKLAADGRDAGKIQRMVNDIIAGNKKEKPKKKTKAQVVEEIILGIGHWGVGQTRVKNIKDYGYNPTEIQNMVNDAMNKKKPSKKSTEAVAKAVIRGDYGNGKARKEKLEKEGYDYYQVQALVDKLLKVSNKPSEDAVVTKVIRGDYGNGKKREDALRALGHDPYRIQSLVNKRLKGK